MGSNGRKIPDSAAKLQTTGALSEVETKLFGLDKDRNSSPHVNLKYLQTDFQCFSEWTSDELKDLSSFINKMAGTNWPDIFKTGGSVGNKKGLGMTYHKDRNKLPKCQVLDQISKDIDFFELRVSQRARVHGFRSVSAFFLVWLDREHKIYPM